MPNITISARVAFRTAVTAGAVALTVAGAALAASAPAEAFVRHGGFHHGGFGGFRHGGFGGFRHGGFGGFRHGGFGGFRHGGFGGARFGGVQGFSYGRGRAFGGYGVRRGIVGYRAFGFRPFAYRVGYPAYRYAYRICPIGRHLVPGLGCRLNTSDTFEVRLRPFAYGYRGFGYGGRSYAFARPFGGHGHRFHHAGFGGFRHGGFHRGGFHHGGFGHGGHFRRR